MPLCTVKPMDGNARGSSDGLIDSATRGSSVKESSNMDLIFNHSTKQGTDSEHDYRILQAGNWSFSGNNSHVDNNTQTTTDKPEPWITINELQMIKVVVLVVVVGILLLSTCRIVFRTFSRYTGKKGDGD